MNFLIDLYQQGRVTDSQTNSGPQSSAGNVTDQLDELQRKTNALALVSQALWEILRDQSGITDAVVLRKMEEIDMRDGKLDGKITAAPVDCPQCGRKNKADRKACIYCGTELNEGEDVKRPV